MKFEAMMTVLLAILLVAVTSCSTPEQTATVKRLGNVALTAGVISGRITPAQADLIRQHGALLLDAPSDEARVAALSAAAVEAAVVTGALSPEEAALLKEAGKVPVTGEPAAVAVVEVTSAK